MKIQPAVWLRIATISILSAMLLGVLLYIIKSTIKKEIDLEVYKVKTGDSLVLQDANTGKTTDIKLSCIKAPDVNTEEGKRSKELLTDLLLEVSTLDITLNQLDVQKDRLVGELYINNININQDIVAKGGAVIDPQYFNCLDKDGYLKSQKTAKDNKLNIWKDD